MYPFLTSPEYGIVLSFNFILFAYIIMLSLSLKYVDLLKKSEFFLKFGKTEMIYCLIPKYQNSQQVIVIYLYLVHEEKHLNYPI